MAIQHIFDCSTGQITEAEVAASELPPPPDPGIVLAEMLDLINTVVNSQVVEAGIMVPQLFYATKIADNALTVARWREAGEPDIPVEWMDAWQAYIDTGDAEVLPTGPEWELYNAVVAEAQAYRSTSDRAMTPVKLLLTWQARWMQMRRGFADLSYARRLQLEQAKMTTQGE